MDPENFIAYQAYLKKWFKQKLPKQVFDYAVKNLLSYDLLQYHNFLIEAIAFNALQLKYPERKNSAEEQFQLQLMKEEELRRQQQQLKQREDEVILPSSDEHSSEEDVQSSSILKVMKSIYGSVNVMNLQHQQVQQQKAQPVAQNPISNNNSMNVPLQSNQHIKHAQHMQQQHLSFGQTSQHQLTDLGISNQGGNTSFKLDQPLPQAPFNQQITQPNTVPKPPMGLGKTHENLAHLQHHVANLGVSPLTHQQLVVTSPQTPVIQQQQQQQNLQIQTNNPTIVANIQGIQEKFEMACTITAQGQPAVGGLNSNIHQQNQIHAKQQMGQINNNNSSNHHQIKEQQKNPAQTQAFHKDPHSNNSSSQQVNAAIIAQQQQAQHQINLHVFHQHNSIDSAQHQQNEKKLEQQQNAILNIINQQERWVEQGFPQSIPSNTTHQNYQKYQQTHQQIPDQFQQFQQQQRMHYGGVGQNQQQMDMQQKNEYLSQNQYCGMNQQNAAQPPQQYPSNLGDTHQNYINNDMLSYSSLSNFNNQPYQQTNHQNTYSGPNNNELSCTLKADMTLNDIDLQKLQEGGERDHQNRHGSHRQNRQNNHDIENKSLEEIKDVLSDGQNKIPEQIYPIKKDNRRQAKANQNLKREVIFATTQVKRIQKEQEVIHHSGIPEKQQEEIVSFQQMPVQNDNTNAAQTIQHHNAKIDEDQALGQQIAPEQQQIQSSHNDINSKEESKEKRPQQQDGSSKLLPKKRKKLNPHQLLFETLKKNKYSSSYIQDESGHQNDFEESDQIQKKVPEIVDGYKFQAYGDINQNSKRRNHKMTQLLKKGIKNFIQYKVDVLDGLNDEELESFEQNTLKKTTLGAKQNNQRIISILKASCERNDIQPKNQEQLVQLINDYLTKFLNGIFGQMKDYIEKDLETSMFQNGEQRDEQQQRLKFEMSLSKKLLKYFIMEKGKELGVSKVIRVFQEELL